ncbi:hypothetical protein [Roseomonas sp. CECT 9278]|uniref:hypothetical protein n=1 Tax=Roseomonas sp. CECT 9278 TaxID=2845823 RepID=UPI001E556F6B|nr:hypothetical protein [Roseomonas sp. CECT 9278]
MIAKIEATKAAAPLHNEIAALKAELFAIKDAIRQMREQQALAARTPAAVRARYDAIQ